MEQLTQQQKRFVSEYIKTLNGENAVKAAGYKTKNPKSFAQELLKKKNKIKKIKKQIKIQNKRNKTAVKTPNLCFECSKRVCNPKTFTNC